MFGRTCKEVGVNVRQPAPVQEIWRHSVPVLQEDSLYAASEIMWWGSLINCSGEAAETAHKINVKGPGSNVNQRDSALSTLMTHARRKETARLMGSAIQGNIIRNNT